MVNTPEMKQIVAAELNHHNTPIEVRESVALSDEEYVEVLNDLNEQVEEVFVLATCNRLAVYAFANDLEAVRSFFTRFPGIEEYLEVFPDTESSVNHLFATAAGLESQALGEHQILGQLRNSFDAVRKQGKIGPVFNELLRKAIRVGKRVRGETEIGRFPTSLASVALKVINQHLDEYPRRRVLLLGTGEMANLSAKLLSKSQFSDMAVASQSLDRAKEFAESYNLKVEAYDNLPENLIEYDIVIGATASHKPVFDTKQFQNKGIVNNLLLIDMGIPRNFDSNLRELETIRLFDLDDIKDRTQKSLNQRRKEIPKAREIIAEEWDKFQYWFNSRNVTPLIAELYDQLEDIKEEEYHWALNKLKEPDANHEWILQRLLHRMVRKFVKNPVDQVKEYAQNNNQLRQPDETFRQVFDLKKNRFNVEKKKIILGTRGSKLALIQTNNVINLLKRFAPDYEFEVKTIKTSGDTGDLSPIGAFCKEIDNALINREIDLAVHCLKDMPTGLPEGLEIGAILERDDHRDALLSRENKKLEDLPRGAIVGTSSMRRSIQVRAIRPDIDVQPLRGNVNTRIRKMNDGQYDAIVLGAAGLQRMDMLGEVTELLPVSKMVPCVGQGILALEIRELDVYLSDLLGVIDHYRSRTAAMAEREYLMALGGGCNMPIGAFATVEGDRLFMEGMLGTDDGSIIKRDTIEGPEFKYKELGRQLAQKLTSELKTHSA